MNNSNLKAVVSQISGNICEDSPPRRVWISGSAVDSTAGTDEQYGKKM